MNDHLQDAIQQADRLIKEGQLRSAAKVLLPYQNHPAARRRLAWLEQKRQQALQAQEAQKSRKASQARARRTALLALVVIAGLGVVAAYGLSQREAVPPASSELEEATPLPSDAAAGVPDAPPATALPAVENPQEASLQQQLRDWFVSVEGVTQVQSLDVDVSDEQPPLVYAEIAVEPGFNDTRIPDIFVQKLNDALHTTQFSSFVVIVSDTSQVVEYSLNFTNNEWQQTLLSSMTPST